MSTTHTAEDGISGSFDVYACSSDIISVGRYGDRR
jgi:hypothetical protein